MPAMGVAISFFLLLLAGIPHMFGFFGKYYVFAAAVQAGLIPLVIVGVLASDASVYYYLRAMVYLYLKEAHKEYTLFTPGALFKITIVLLAILTVYYDVVPIHPIKGLMELIPSYYSGV